jgi:hypothetical protein
MTTIFSVASHAFPAGPVSSAQFTFPLGFTEIDMTLTNMSQTDLDDTSLSIEIKLMVDREDGNGFVENNGYTWGGGILVGKPPATKPPLMPVFNAAELAGHPGKVDAVFSRPVTCGILVSGV